MNNMHIQVESSVPINPIYINIYIFFLLICKNHNRTSFDTA